MGLPPGRRRPTTECYRVALASRYGRVEINDSGNIVSFEEKTQATGPGMINAGIYLMDTALIRAIPDRPCSLEKDIFPKRCGNRLGGFVTDAPFLDIGTKQTYQSAPDFFTALEGAS